MPGPRTPRKRYTLGSNASSRRVGREAAVSSTPSSSAPSSSPQRAARNFVEKHVRFDPPNLPSFKPTAVKGLQKAARDVGLAPESISTQLKQLRDLPKAKPEAGPRLSEANRSTQGHVYRQRAQQARKQLRRLFDETPKEQRPILRKQIELAAAQRELKRKNNSPGPGGIGTANTKPERRLVRQKKQDLNREINRAADLGHIEHPKMPHGLGRVVGDLIPDQPWEIALDAGTAGIGGLVASSGGRLLVQAGKEAGAAAKATRGLRKFPAIGRGAAKPLKESAPGQALERVSQISKSNPARVAKAGAVGAAFSTGHAAPFVEGTVKGAVEHPRATAETTLRGLASIPAAGMAAAAAGVTTARRLTDPDQYTQRQGLGYAFTPVTRLAEENWKEAKKEFDVLTSKDPERIAEATAKDYGVLPAVGAAALARPLVGPLARAIGRGAWSHTPDAVKFPLADAMERRRVRRQVDVRSARDMTARGARERDLTGETARANRRLNAEGKGLNEGQIFRDLEDFAASKTEQLAGQLPKDRRGRTVPIRLRPGDLVPLVASGRLTDASPAAALREVDAHLERMDRDGIPATSPERIQFEAIKAHPEILSSPHFHKAVDEYRAAAGEYQPQVFDEDSTNQDLRSDSPESRIAHLLPVAADENRIFGPAREGEGYEPIMRPEEVTPEVARPYTDAKTREEAVGAGTVESYKRSEIAQERKALKAEQGKHPDFARADEEVAIAESGVRAAKQAVVTARRNNKGTVRGNQVYAQALATLDHAKERLKLAKAERTAVRKRNPQTERARELERRIEMKAATMGPVRLTANERRAALQALGPGSSPNEKRAALTAAQQAKREARDAPLLEQATQEFVGRVREAMKSRGMKKVPAYYPNINYARRPQTQMMPGFERGGVGKGKPRSLGDESVQARGNVRYSVEGMMESLGTQARREVQRDSAEWFNETFQQTHDLGNGEQGEFTPSQIAKMEESNQIDPENTVRVPASFWDRPSTLDSILATRNPYESALQKISAEGQGNKYRLYDKAAFERWLNGMAVQSNLAKWLRRVGRTESRLLLSTSFSWMFAQVFAEGMLLALDHPNPMRMMRVMDDLKRINDDPKARRNLQYLAESGRSTLDQDWGDPQRQTRATLNEVNRTPMGNMLKKLAMLEYPGEFDRAKGSLFRELYLLGDIDKAVDSRARSWARALGDTYTAIDEAARKLAPMTPEERVNWLNTPEGRRAGEAFQVALDEGMGAWSRMAPWERSLSHVIIFYPFLRFSLNWAFHTFPKNHPVRYTIATNMAQWNAEQLEHWLTKEPSFFTGWMMAPIYGQPEGPPTGFASFSRIAPGSNALIEAIGQAKSWQELVTGLLRPSFGAAARAFRKVDEFGNPLPEDASQLDAIAKQFLRFSPPTRVLENYFNPSDSPGAPSRTEYAARSGLFPFYPEDYRSAKLRATSGELWGKVGSGFDQSGVRDSSRYKELSNKYGDWREETADALGPINEPADIKRYLAYVGPKNRADVEEYLNSYLSAKNGEKQTEQATRRLVTLYGREGSKLTPYLTRFYSDNMDTGRRGPRAGMAAPTRVASAKPAPKPKPAPKKNPMARNEKIAAKVGDDRLTADMVGEYARAARVTGVPASILAGIHRIEQGFGTIDKGGDAQTRTSSDGTFLSAYNIMADAWGKGHQLDRGAKALGYKKPLDPTNLGDGAIAAGIVLLNNGFRKNPEAALRAYSGGGYGMEVGQGLESLNQAKPMGGSVVPKVKHPNARPFKGLIPVSGDFDLSRGMSQAKWDKLPMPGHGDTVINKAVNPIVKAWATKFGIGIGEGFAPPPSDHRSAEHLVTGTATDVYPRNENWDRNSKEFKDFEKGIRVLTKAGLTVYYDGSIKGTTPMSNHGYGNHAHVIWLNADGSGGEALQKLTGMTNQQIANAAASVRSMGAASSYSGGSGGGGGSTAVSSSGGGGGSSSSSSSFSPEDYSKLSAVSGLTESLPSTDTIPSVLPTLSKLRKKRITA